VSLAGFAHPPEAENDGKMEYRNIGSDLYRVENIMIHEINQSWIEKTSAPAPDIL